MNNTKDEYLHIRVTTEEKQKIATEAERVGISVSAFILLLVNQYIQGISCTKSNINISTDVLKTQGQGDA